MKKMMTVLIVMILCSLSYGNIFPIFDGDRSPWINLQWDDIPIFVDSGTELGLTNDRDGTAYAFRFDIDYGNLIFHIPTPIVGNINIHLLGNSLRLNGIHEGPGNPIDNIVMEGNAYVSVYKVEIRYNYIGSFTVGDPVPEPSSILLLCLGMFGIRKCRN